jgi:ribosomal protein L11 methyltransferase
VCRYALPAAAAEALYAELDSLGTLGLEERDAGDGQVVVLAYFAAGGAEDAALAAATRVDPRARWLGCEPVPHTDWERAWRAGLAPRRIARLWVRPSWCAPAGSPEIVIDPKQAFGSGEHATTRLALELLLEALQPGDRLLDVGCGSGILALGALRCGAASAVGFDLDPVACANAAENRRLNALPLALFCGTLDALARSARFDVVVANLLWSQLESCLPGLLELPRRALVVSGLLAAQRPVALARLCEGRLELIAKREELQGGDAWCALRLHRRSLQS